MAEPPAEVQELLDELHLAVFVPLMKSGSP
jgi:hypothetical protein